MYEAILDSNLASRSIAKPAAKDIYLPPVWFEGKWVCLSEHDDIDYSSYIRALNVQFYRDRDFFRTMVMSFFGPRVASVHEVVACRRPCIQIAFGPGWNHSLEQDKYAETVEMFAYMMGRLRLVGGLTPVTKVFGFKFLEMRTRGFSSGISGLLTMA
ncbi:hypothetical protein GGR52DRAFT_556220 [Hypoxylon sp. FL1284]|nr:hypothetical protein GGR52DRAFT_556220 [Hypoxylon sp. FL1284]